MSAPTMSEQDWQEFRAKVERAMSYQAATGIAGVVVGEIHMAPGKPVDIRCRIAARVY